MFVGNARFESLVTAFQESVETVARLTERVQALENTLESLIPEPAKTPKPAPVVDAEDAPAARRSRGRNKHRAIPDEEVLRIVADYLAGSSMKELSLRYGVSTGLVGSLLDRKCYADIELGDAIEKRLAEKRGRIPWRISA